MILRYFCRYTLVPVLLQKVPVLLYCIIKVATNVPCYDHFGVRDYPC